jgi:hypothetical protein
MCIDLQVQWCGLVDILNQGVLNDSVDRPKWQWQKMENLVSRACISSCGVMKWTDPSDTRGRAKSPLKSKCGYG